MQPLLQECGKNELNLLKNLSMKAEQVFAFIAGAALGAAAVWLFTSESGARLREDIRNQFNPDPAPAGSEKSPENE